MGEKFESFKRRALVLRILKSVLLGLAVGLLSSGVLLLLWRFEVLPSGLTLAIIVGASSVPLFGVGLYFLLWRSDKAVAARLDREFGLQERVGTMLQYREYSTPMHELQRADANAALAALPLRGMGVKTVWIYVTSALLAVLVFISSFVFKPKEVVPPPPEEIPFSLSAMQEAALIEATERVRASEMRSPYRENTVLAMEALLETLRTADTESEKEEAVSLATELILAEVDGSSAALELIEEIWNTGSAPAKEIAELLNYYSWPKNDESGGYDRCETNMGEVKDSFLHPDAAAETPDEEKLREETALLLKSVSVALGSALLRSELPNDDALFAAVDRLASADEVHTTGAHVYGLAKLAELLPVLGYEGTVRELDDALFSQHLGAIHAALAEHRVSTSTGEDAVTRICQILNSRLPGFERPVLREIGAGGDSSGGDGDGGGAGGGIGSGTEYGSDDLVLDPNTNTYVEYGTILDRYYAIMFAKLQDGSYTEEERAAMEKYFAILYGGFDEEKGEG